MVLPDTPWTLAGMQLLVAVIHTIPPLAAALSVASVFLHVQGIPLAAWLTFPSIVTGYVYLEAVFFVYFQACLHTLQKPLQAPIMSAQDRDQVLKRILDHPKPMLEEFLSGWFFWTSTKRQLTVKELESVYRENLLDWLAWAMFSESSFDEMSTNPSKEARVLEVHKVLELFEHQLNMRFHIGHNPRLSTVKLNSNPVDAYPKPLIFYIVMKGLECVEVIFLNSFGYRRRVENGLAYWVRYPSDVSDANDSATPIVFVHGIGVGLFQYMGFAHELSKTQSRPIFLIELPHITMRFSQHASTTVERSVQVIDEMLASHGFTKIHLVGHSWGTAVVSWMIKQSTCTIASVVFLDPIVFFPVQQELAFNFVHRKPGYNTTEVRANEYMIHFIVAREIHISHTISRHFSWHHNLLWPDELPHHHLVVGARRDMLFNGNSMSKYLEANNIHHTMNDVDHGAFLFIPEVQTRILRQIKQVCEDADADS
ncbi:hypothetical protein HDU98_003554 [Podochytrium sp. JEL0797]|nr:hypothetical protein HDU98_003554 [Podochytrium sp. JEL0797]